MMFVNKGVDVMAKMHICVLMALAAVTAGFSIRTATAGTPLTAKQRAELIEQIEAARAVKAMKDAMIGRFQVINPQPERAVHIMLLDSATGETWQLCGSEREQYVRWCAIERGGVLAGAPKDP